MFASLAFSDFRNRSDMRITGTSVRIVIKKTPGSETPSISDNRAGMEAGRLEEIRNMLFQTDGDFNHIGLLNTNRQLRLMFGDAFCSMSNNPHFEGPDLFIERHEKSAQLSTVPIANPHWGNLQRCIDACELFFFNAVRLG